MPIRRSSGFAEGWSRERITSNERARRAHGKGKATDEIPMYGMDPWLIGRTYFRTSVRMSPPDGARAGFHQDQPSPVNNWTDFRGR